MSRSFWPLIGAWVLISGPAAPGAAPDFNRDVRPILAENCFKCHGPDAQVREAELRLDVPGDISRLVDGDQQLLVTRINSTDPDQRMPPPSSGKSLTAEQIEALTQWAGAGAPYTAHWSFVEPVRPVVPQVDGVDHPIDRFLLAALREQGVDYSPEADPVTLLRRLHFDITGLPPTSAEVTDYLNEDRRSRLKGAVERLLDSPHYGERMAIYWLDLVRYADTNGYHGDNYRSVWPYRDYVIRAFNSNKPFDQFTIEQLAGDLLPDATRDQQVASAYNRLNMITAEGGAQAKEYLAKYAADRVRTTSTAWLGVTLGCAECHDHKFDPFTSEDFYRFAAYFADLQERGVYGGGTWDPELALPSDEQAAKQAAIDEQIAEINQRIAEETKKLAAAREQWEADLRAQTQEQDLAFQPLAPVQLKTTFGVQLEPLPDHSILAKGKKPNNEVYAIDVATDAREITALRLEALTHPSLAGGKLSRGNGNFVLTGVTVDRLDAETDNPVERVAIARAEADYEAESGPVAGAIDTSAEDGWIVNGHLHRKDRHALFVFKEPLSAGPGTRLRITLRHESIYANHEIGRFRLSVTTTADPHLPKSTVPDDILRIVVAGPEGRKPEDLEFVAEYYESLAPELEALRSQVTTLLAEKEKVQKTVPTVLVSVSVDPRTVRVLPRGNWMDDSGPEVTPAPPSILVGQGGDRVVGASRLDLARWLVDRRNPLTARVFVNRLWKLFHGAGLSRALDDFGAQGMPPRYAELLDWLAMEFVESGWDVKHMVRLMTTSRCYRQSSRVSDQLLHLDPENHLLARQQSFRLDAELVRDNALAVSGLLVPEIGGPSVKPYQPPGYWAQLNFPVRKYQRDQGAGLYRRGLYTYWMRTFLHPSMVAFDAPPREECTVARSLSTTPLQALVLLNDPAYVEAARGLAERIVTEASGSPAERIVWAYEQVLSRVPTQNAAEVLAATFYQQLSNYQEDRSAAEALTSVGELKSPENFDRSELAAWTAVSRVLLNLHETITRY